MICWADLLTELGRKMRATTSSHALVRARQRSIPPVVHRWLDEFGENQHDGHGAVRVYFSHRSIRAMESALGSHFVRQNRKYLRAYRIENVPDGCTITVGWRTCRVKRKKSR
jgi:hypothetical protein